MKQIIDLIRPHFMQIKPGQSLQQEHQNTGSLLLNANESPYDTGFNRYPDPSQAALKKQIAKRKGIRATNIFLGNGSTEIADLLIRLFCEPGKDHIITISPSNQIYQQIATCSNVAVNTIALTSDFQLDVPAILAQSNSGSKLLFICSPNNPTGNLMNKEAVLHLADTFPGITVLDEAYIDFSGDNSLVKVLAAHPRLLILQTFSIAWGLAGIRLGMAFGAKPIIAWLQKIKLPHHLNIISQDTALLTFENDGEVKDWITETIEQRNWLEQQLATLPFVKKVFPSDANFLLVQVEHPKETYEYLKVQGILVADYSNVPGCTDCLRITVGTPSDNCWLMEILREHGKRMAAQAGRKPMDIIKKVEP